MKKTFLLMLGFIMAASMYAQVWDGTATSWTSGSGSQADPYLIETPQHLAYLSEQVRAGETYEGKYFKLASDLDMGGDKDLKFSPIGFFDEYVDPEDQSKIIDDSKYFLGVFDGNYKTIDNVYIYYMDEVNSVGGTGLFACISGNAVIKNLSIGNRSKIEGLDSSGLFVGTMKGGTISNCVNNAELSLESGWYHGGIVGLMNGGVISGCVNSAKITSLTGVAGIAGYVDGDVIIENCYNTSEICFTGMYGGGLVGSIDSGVLRNSYNYGKVWTPDELGYMWGAAVAGSVGWDDSWKIENCYYLTYSDGLADENTGVTAKTEAEMKGAEFLAALDKGQGVWVADGQNLNSGYPILKWQADIASSISNVTSEISGDIIVDGHNVSTTIAGARSIVITSLDGQIVVQGDINDGGVYVPAKGYFVATVYGDGVKHSRKIIIK